MRKKPIKINKEDLDAFHSAVSGTKPLKIPDKVRLKPPLSRKKPVVAHNKQEKETLHLNESLELDAVAGEEFISYKQAGISNKILRNLRKGQYNVQATLDLHGFIVDDAKEAVDEFLQHCLQDSIRVALIIHGKGHHSEMPVLKNKLNHWLRELPSVLAFCSATTIHGSRGAIYVLLKRHAREDYE